MKNIFEPFLTIVSLFLISLVMIASISAQLQIIEGRNKFYEKMDTYSSGNVARQYTYKFDVTVPIFGTIISDYKITGYIR